MKGALYPRTCLLTRPRRGRYWEEWRQIMSFHILIYWLAFHPKNLCILVKPSELRSVHTCCWCSVAVRVPRSGAPLSDWRRPLPNTKHPRPRRSPRDTWAQAKIQTKQPLICENIRKHGKQLQAGQLFLWGVTGKGNQTQVTEKNRKIMCRKTFRHVISKAGCFSGQKKALL